MRDATLLRVSAHTSPSGGGGCDPAQRAGTARAPEGEGPLKELGTRNQDSRVQRGVVEFRWGSGSFMNDDNPAESHARLRTYGPDALGIYP